MTEGNGHDANGWKFALIPSARGRPAVYAAREGDGEPYIDRCDIADRRAREDLRDRLHRLTQLSVGYIDAELRRLASEYVAAEAEKAKVRAVADAFAEAQAQDAETDAFALGAVALEKTPEDVRAEARAMLESPRLLELIGDDFTGVGIAGERALAGMVYLVGVSRLLDRPLAVLIQGPSSSGKSYVAKNVVRLFPGETRVIATSMSAQALYYAVPGCFRHRFVFCGERSRKTDDDAAEVTRALREMLSEGRLSRLVTVKQPSGAPTAELVCQEGPIAYCESTTLPLADVFPEDLNRMLVIGTNETPDQTRRVLRAVGRKYQGAAVGDAARVEARHHAMQRLLEPLPVVVPFASRLVEALPATRLEMRRGAGYVLALVAAVGLLHQFQRARDGNGAVAATLDDYRAARALLVEPLGRLLGRRVGDGALRFLARLAEWFGLGGTYTLPEARARETGSPSSVYQWNSDLLGAGLVELVERKDGRAPARWRVASSPDDAADALCLLPEPEALM